MFGRRGSASQGRAGAAARARAAPGVLVWRRPAARSPRPAPASAPPAASPPFTNVRRSTLLSCSGPMLSMRALIVGLAAALGLGLATAAAHAAARAPRCTPTTLNTSAMKDGSVTVSPLSGSRDASAANADQLPRGSRARESATSASSARVTRRARGSTARLLAGRRRELRAGASVRARRAGDRARRGGQRRCRAAPARHVRDRRAGSDHAHAGEDLRGRPRRSAERSPRARTCTRRRSPSPCSRRASPRATCSWRRTPVPAKRGR